MMTISVLGQRPRLLAAVLGFVLLLGGCPQGEDPPSASVISVDKAAAERLGFTVMLEPVRSSPISFSDSTGQSLSLEAFEGKVVLLNLWATWCPPCREDVCFGFQPDSNPSKQGLALTAHLRSSARHSRSIS